MSLNIPLFAEFSDDELINAVIEGDTGKIKEYLGSDGDITKDLKSKGISNTLGGWALKYKKPKVLKFLLENGFDVNFVNRDGISLVQLAILYSHDAGDECEKNLEFLILYGADIYEPYPSNYGTISKHSLREALLKYYGDDAIRDPAKFAPPPKYNWIAALLPIKKHKSSEEMSRIKFLAKLRPDKLKLQKFLFGFSDLNKLLYARADFLIF